MKPCSRIAHRWRWLAALWPLCLIASAPLLAQSANDGFHPDLVGGLARVLAAQPDGKLLVAGNFTQIGGGARRGLARLHANGRIDLSFFADPGEGNDLIFALALQPDGKVLVGGQFTDFAGTGRANLVRLEPDGRVDQGFEPEFSGKVLRLAVQPDGKLLVSGYQGDRLARLNPDGSRDAAFIPPQPFGAVYDFGLLPGGKLLIGGDFTELNGTGQHGRLARLNADGSVDESFAPAIVGESVRRLVVQPGGRIVIAGKFASVDGQPRGNIARLNPDGSLDGSFAPPAMDDVVWALAMTPDGRWFIGGLFQNAGGTPRHYIARLGIFGNLDTGFDPGANTYVGDFALLPDGKVVAAGAFNLFGGQPYDKIVRLNLDRSVDEDFAPQVEGGNPVLATAIQPDGKVLIGGYFNDVGGVARPRIARLNGDGRVDTGFNANANGSVTALAIEPDGKILAGGYFSQIGGGARLRLARLELNGVLDASLNAQVGGVYAAADVRAIVAQPDGKILIGGNFFEAEGAAGAMERFHMARLDANGQVDNSFVPGGSFAIPGANGIVETLALQADGKILVGGQFTSFGTQSRAHLARLNENGTLDPGFTVGANDDVRHIARQADGKILVAGHFTEFGGQPRSRLARLEPDGTLDPGFLPAFDGYVYNVAVQLDGRILASGGFTQVNGAPRAHIARLEPDGTLDPGFDPGADNWLGLLLQADGKGLANGGFAELGGQPRHRLGRVSTAQAALQRLEVQSDRVRWLRGGAGGELDRVWFESARVGETVWTPLGMGARIVGGWELAGLDLPLETDLLIRARGDVGGNRGNALLETVRLVYLRPSPEVFADGFEAQP